MSERNSNISQDGVSGSAASRSSRKSGTPKGFASLAHLAKNYPYFDLDEEKTVYKDSRPLGVRFDGGIPLGYDKDNRRLVVDTSDTHTLVYGSTGSLKTRAIVMPTIKLLGAAGESMVINDTKGELYDKTAGWLREKGYRIIDINLRDPDYGHRWNMFAIPYAFYLEGDMDRAAEFTHDIANNLATSDRSEKDPYWDNSSADLFFGLSLLLFKYAKEHDISPNAVNISNLLTLKREIFNSKGSSNPANSNLWKYGAEDELIAASLSGTVFAPSDTRNSTLSVFDTKMRYFTIRTSLLDMLSKSDFDIADIGNEKTAVYIITPDEKTSYHKIVAMFIKQSYEYLINSATKNDSKKVNIRINYILDEFSSIPHIPDMPTMISAARSRDIRFLLVAQSKGSLKLQYQEDADTIIANCSNWIFFTSRELSLLNEISELCGERKTRGHTRHISVYELQHLDKKKHQAIILAGREKPVKASMLDIDKFGGLKMPMIPHEKREHTDRERLKFELKPEIKDRLLPEILRSSVSENKPPQIMKPPLSEVIRDRIAELNN